MLALLLDPEFVGSPALASVWAQDMLAAGFEGDALVDVAVLAHDEWERLARKITPALQEAGLGEDAAWEKLALELLDRRLEELGGAAWLDAYDGVASRLFYETLGWRRDIAICIHEIGDALNLIHDGFDPRAPDFEVNAFIAGAWRNFRATGALPLDWHR